MKFKVVFISFLLTTFLFHLSESKGHEKSSECKCPRRTPTYCETAVKYVTGAVAAVRAVAATPVVLGAAGFNAAGVAPGVAADAMDAQGIFATLQSVGAAGLGLGGKLGLGSISAAVGTGIGSFAARVCGEEVECGPCEEENTKG